MIDFMLSADQFSTDIFEAVGSVCDMQHNLCRCKMSILSKGTACVSSASPQTLTNHMLEPEVLGNVSRQEVQQMPLHVVVQFPRECMFSATQTHLRLL